MIIRELTIIRKKKEMTGEQVLPWVRRVKTQRVQKPFIEAIEDNKECDIMKRYEQKNKTRDRKERCNNCRYCGSAHKPRRCPAYLRGVQGVRE